MSVLKYLFNHLMNLYKIRLHLINTECYLNAINTNTQQSSSNWF